MPARKLRALSPYHLGEPLVAKLLQMAGEDILRLGAFDVSAQKMRTFGDYEREAPIDVVPNAHLGPNKNDIPFDGMHDIDCALIYPTYVRAFELKLGASRMGADEFRRRFVDNDESEQSPDNKGPSNLPYISTHDTPQMGGSMVAILDWNGREPPEMTKQPPVVLTASRYEASEQLRVEPDWLLVTSAATLTKWKKSETPLVKALGTVQLRAILTLEDIAELIGTSQAQEAAVELVRESVAGWFKPTKKVTSEGSRHSKSGSVSKRHSRTATK